MTIAEPISFRRKLWVVQPAAEAAATQQLSREIRISEPLARLLIGRGIGDPAMAHAFLRPEFKKLHSPELLPNMNVAAERLVRSIRDQEQIVLFGDYDVDGITGTAMLWHVISAAGGKVKTYIPHRVEEGYGLSVKAIEDLAADGAKLIVSIDCGGTACEAVAAGRAKGVDIIVTDHHELGETLPDATVMVHPRMTGSQYPNGDLCGAGVAFKLAWATAQLLSGGAKVSDVYRKLLVEFAALVGLGTIADVVPLVGENRILAKYGLAQLPRSGLTGIQALIAAAGYGERTIDGTAVGFGLAPRINAAGRMDHADMALELLTSADAAKAKEIAEYLEQQNRDRQATERKMVEAAIKQIEEQLAQEGELPLVLVVHSEAHHAGVVGIVASRLVDKYHRPAFVLACDAEECYGSARSVAGFAIHEAIEHVRALLISGGGHAMAGGVKFERKNLEAFREGVNEFAANVLSPDDLVAKLPVDTIITLREANVEFAKNLAMLEPHGRSNPKPKFLIQNLRISAPPRRVGSTGTHLQMMIKQGETTAKAIAFKAGDAERFLPVGAEIDLVVEIKLDSYQGVERAELLVCDMARCDGTAMTE